MTVGDLGRLMFVSLITKSRNLDVPLGPPQKFEIASLTRDLVNLGTETPTQGSYS